MNDPGEGILKTVAFVFVVPAYLLAAWLVARFGGETAVVDAESKLLVFGICSGVGLGCAVLSPWVRAKVSARPVQGEWTPRMKALAFALALSEAPALAGLVYFILLRDGLGFALLLGATVLAFIYHALGPLPGDAPVE